MKLFALTLSAFFLLSSLALGSGPERKAPLPPLPAQQIPILDPNRTAYPRSSLHDFGDLLDGPAGKYGFLTVRDGHFYWPNGKRARFWGINVANTSLQEPDAAIDAMIRTFKAAGFNLVRLHHFDERGGIIDLDAPDSRHFVESRVRKLDYWIYKAREAGIYVYLDLLDYRHFKLGDGVPNAEAIGRSAKPYAVFDPRLIELQKEYAMKLLHEHVNPYTGLTYAEDPAIAMLEMYDENGLFMRRGLWRSMPEPYNTEFKHLWNDWLRERYSGTGNLAAAWTDAGGNTVLGSNESLEKGNVELPAMTWTPNQLRPEDVPYSALPRRNDGARFAGEIHRQYLRDMKRYLVKDIGVKVPICVTGRYDDLADRRSEAEEMDFIGCNFYYDHPYWGSGAPQWQLPSFFHNLNPLHHIDERSMAAATSLARVKGKPFVVREWNYCWPNRNRSAGMVEAAVYAALHDFDAMILFVYEAKPKAAVSYFNVRSDPSRWGLCGIGAQVFLKGLVQPSQHEIVVPYNEVDTYTYTKYHQPFYALGWATRVENDFFDGKDYVAPPGTDLIVLPGRSAVGQYTNAPAVLYTGDLRQDLAGRTRLAPEYLEGYNMEPRQMPFGTLLYNGLLFDDGAVQDRALPLAIPLSRLTAAGLRPIGVNEAAGVANGFVDQQNKRLVFGSLGGYDVLRAALDAMSLFHNVQNNHDDTEHNAFRSDTGELFRDAASGRLVVSSPNFQALCGNLVGVGGLSSGLGIRNGRNGTLVALSLDGKPIVSSRCYVIKMVTDARNADEVAEKDPRTARDPHGQWKLDSFGEGPVVTIGKPLAAPMQVSLGGRPVLDVYLEGGSWELYVDGDDRQFYCDTPGIRFALRSTLPVGGDDSAPMTAKNGKTWTKVAMDGTRVRLDSPSGSSSGTMAYPSGAASIRISG